MSIVKSSSTWLVAEHARVFNAKHVTKHLQPMLISSYTRNATIYGHLLVTSKGVPLRLVKQTICHGTFASCTTRSGHSLAPYPDVGHGSEVRAISGTIQGLCIWDWGLSNVQCVMRVGVNGSICRNIFVSAILEKNRIDAAYVTCHSVLSVMSLDMNLLCIRNRIILILQILQALSPLLVLLQLLLLLLPQQLISALTLFLLAIEKIKFLLFFYPKHKLFSMNLVDGSSL